MNTDWARMVGGCRWVPGLLLVVLVGGLIAGCVGTGNGGDSAPAADPCATGMTKDDPLRVLSTTGQIGSVVDLILGLEQIPDGLWDPGTLAERTGIAVLASIDAGAEPSLAAMVRPSIAVETHTMLGPGVDPHLYVPTLGDAEEFNKADVIFYNGLHLEAQMLGALEELSGGRCVVALGDLLYQDQNLVDRFIHTEDGLVDPHIWNHPELWSLATLRMAQVLEGMYTEPVPEFAANAEKVAERITMAGLLIAELFAGDRIPVRYLVTAHDAFGYFTAVANLESIGLQGLSTESEASIYDIQQIAETIVAHRIPAMFVESSVSTDAVTAVREAVRARGWDVRLGGELYSDALGPQGSEGETYLGMLQHNAVTVYLALAEPIPEDGN